MTFQLVGNPNKSVKMAAYMKNHFIFLGIPTPERKKQSKEFIKNSKKLNLPEFLTTLDTIWQQKAREYQYVAIDLALANLHRLTFSEIKILSRYLSEKTWWDSVDAWRKLFAEYIQLHPEEREQVFKLFFGQPDFWMRRVAINLQLLAKEKTDLNLLTEAILWDLKTDEFFIQKAIGWALRDYSKTDPTWVRAFIDAHPLSPLAVREGSKYLSI